MIRVVIDTNILVSAALRPDSLPGAVLLLALSDDVQLCLSAAVLAEYDDVIRRPHFKLSADAVGSTMQKIRRVAYWVEPVVHVEECADPDDNIFLECAEAAKAHYIVTGNQRHFPPRWKRTQVISAREFIELLAQRD